MSKHILVVALERGHDGDVIRAPGEQFHVPESRLIDGSTWFEPVDDAEGEKVRARLRAAPAAEAPAKPAEKPAVVKPTRPPGSGPAPGSRAGKAPGEAQS